MFEPKIKLQQGLYNRLKDVAEKAGYASIDEFVVDLLEKAASDAEAGDSEEQVRKRLQGLGYLA